MTNAALENETPAVNDIRESANRIWLAGLGAFAKTQKKSQKLFKTLVQEGEKVEKRAKETATDRIEEAKDNVEEFRSKANDQVDRLEELFQERVAQVLHRLGVPTQADIQELSQRIEELNASVLALKK